MSTKIFAICMGLWMSTAANAAGPACNGPGEREIEGVVEQMKDLEWVLRVRGEVTRVSLQGLTNASQARKDTHVGDTVQICSHLSAKRIVNLRRSQQQPGRVAPPVIDDRVFFPA